MGRRITNCEICNEPLQGEMAEMYDAENPEEDSVICHPECGLANGLEVA